jgi:hypothetical protein
MKYLLTLMMFNVFCASGQIGAPQKITPSTIVGKIAPMGAFIAELSYRPNEADETDTTYTLRFNNMKYTHIDAITSVQFSGIGNAVSGLYKVFKSVFSEENKSNKDYTVQFTLGKELVSISHTKGMGITSAMFLIKDAYFMLTEKQVDKLFGKL